MKYLLEIFVEEFPSRYIESTKLQLKENFEKNAKEFGLTYDEIHLNSTPRRFVLIVDGVRSAVDNEFEILRGPQKKIAFDENQEPSKALLGFLNSKKLSFEDIYFETVKNVEYVFAKVKKEAIDVKETLSKIIPKSILQISNPRSMRWGSKNIKFLRPIRSLISLLDTEIVDFDLDGIKVGNTTNGHRILGKTNITIPSVEEYEQLLLENGVIVDEKKREDIILRGINRIAREKDGIPFSDEELLKEVVSIVEYPTVFIGNMPIEYMALPKEIIITPMKDHQRYFPVLSQDKTRLLPYFISVRNGDVKGIDNVIRGNERVLIPRLEDAKFFYDQDTKSTLESYVPKLSGLGYHDGLGNMLDKSNRLVRIVEILSEEMNVADETLEYAKRAAYLSKADLVTKTVIEFTELQGVMGRIYAELSGENEIVSEAIEQQYMPLNANSELPSTTVGILLSLADKLDTIVGLFSFGVRVTGSQDPYGLRRYTLGILKILMENKIFINLKNVFRDIMVLYVDEFKLVFDSKEVISSLVEFFNLRLKNLLLSMDYRYDIIDSVLDISDFDIAKMVLKILAVSQYLSLSENEENISSFLRLLNITDKYTSTNIDEKLLEENDKLMYELVNDLSDIDVCIDRKKYFEALSELSDKLDIVNNYMDNTKILVDDEKIAQNRVAMLKTFSSRVDRIFNPKLIVKVRD